MTLKFIRKIVFILLCSLFISGCSETPNNDFTRDIDIGSSQTQNLISIPNLTEGLKISVKSYSYYASYEYRGVKLSLKFENRIDSPVKITVMHGNIASGISLFNSSRKITRPLDEFTIAPFSEILRDYFIPRTKLEDIKNDELLIDMEINTKGISQMCSSRMTIEENNLAEIEFPQLIKTPEVIATPTHTPTPEDETKSSEINRIYDYFQRAREKIDTIIEESNIVTETPKTPTEIPASKETSEDSDYLIKPIEPIKPSINTRELEKRIHELINKERKKQGLLPLRLDEKLSIIARKHSQDMAENDYFSHINLRGESPTDRGIKERYYCRKDFGSYYTEGLAENIFQNWLYDSITYYDGIAIHDWNTMEDLAQSTVQGWMESPGHRSNILNPSFDREGIGVAIANSGKVYITQDFC